MKWRDWLGVGFDTAVRTRPRFVFALFWFAVAIPAVFMLVVPRSTGWTIAAGVVAVLSGCVVPVIMLHRRHFTGEAPVRIRRSGDGIWRSSCDLVDRPVRRYRDLPKAIEDLPLEDFRPVRPYGGPGAPWEPEAVGMQSTFGSSQTEADYDRLHGIQSKHWLTIIRPEDATWIIERLGDRIVDKVVVEIGAGIGVLAVAMAKKARHVYAIEASPSWGVVFARHMFREKPTNLTWILDRAENLTHLIRADIAIVVTGSDADGLRELAARFAPDVCMPWQDWNDGKAVIRGWAHADLSAVAE